MCCGVILCNVVVQKLRSCVIPTAVVLSGMLGRYNLYFGLSSTDRKVVGGR